MAKLDPNSVDYTPVTYSIEPKPAVKDTEVAPELSFSDMFSDAMKLDNPVLNAVEAFSQNPYPANDAYTVEDYLAQAKAYPRFKEYERSFTGVQSAEEFNAIRNKIENREKMRRDLNAQGLAGKVMSIIAGMLSPTMLLPVLGNASGVLRVAQGIGLGLLAGGTDEVLLDANSPERTAYDDLSYVAGPAIFGGLLGALTGKISAAAKAKGIEDLISGAQDSSRDVVMSANPQATSSAVNSLSAASNEMDAGGLAGSLKVGKGLAFMSPITRALTHKIDTYGGSEAYRNAMWMMSDAGIRAENMGTDLDPLRGMGSVENQILQWDRYNMDLIDTMNNGYASYVGKADAKVAKNLQARVAGTLMQNKLSYDDYSRDLFLTMMSAKRISPAGIDHTAEMKLIDNLLNETGELGADLGLFQRRANYDLPRDWVADKVAKVRDNQGRSFTEALTQHFEKSVKMRMVKLEKEQVSLSDRISLYKELETIPLENVEPTRNAMIAAVEKLKKTVGKKTVKDRVLYVKLTNKLKKGKKLTEKEKLKLELVDNDRVKDFNTSLKENTNIIRLLKKVNSREGFAEVKNARGKMESELAGVMDKAKDLGETNLGRGSSKGDFSNQAREMAERVTDKIAGQGVRLAHYDYTVGAHGSEIERMLNVDPVEFSPWLNTNVQSLISRYIKTVAPDIELARTFGELPSLENTWAKINDEFNTKAKNIEKSRADDKMKRLLSEKLQKQREVAKRDFEGVVQRLRNMRGIPENPNDFWNRAGRVALQLTSLRYLGNVVPASLPDLGRIIMRNGFADSFKHILLPAFREFGNLKLSAREGRYAGAINEAYSHAKMQTLTESLNTINSGTRFEHGLNWLSSKVGLIGGFNFFTDFGKSLDAAVVNGRLFDSMEMLKPLEHVPFEKLNRAQKRAWTYLHKDLGLTDNVIRNIRKEMNGVEKGGGKFNTETGEMDAKAGKSGIWLPNTESWKNRDTVRAYRAALNRHINSTIVTPGVERPLMADADIGMKLLFQFRSFMLSSTMKVTLAGLQQQDRDIVSGIVVSLLLGGLSYALYETSRGNGDKLKDVPAGVWLDEAVNRSGLLGVIADVQAMLKSIPLTQKYAGFGTRQNSRREGATLASFLVGPNADLVQTAGNVIMGLDNPTKGTLHQIRLLLPFQNVFYLRLLLDKLESKTADALDLPETRQ